MPIPVRVAGWVRRRQVGEIGSKFLLEMNLNYYKTGLRFAPAHDGLPAKVKYFCMELERIIPLQPDTTKYKSYRYVRLQ
jgi:hypothetical protein